MGQQVWDKEAIHKLLDSSNAAVLRAARAMHARQTASEQAAMNTTDANGVGFSAFHAEPMTRFVEFANRGWFISDKFMAYARKSMKKYWKQLAEIANERAAAQPQPLEPRIERATAVELQPAPKCDCEHSDGEVTACVGGERCQRVKSDIEGAYS